MSSRRVIVAILAILGLALFLLSPNQQSNPKPNDEFAGWTVLEAKPPAGFQVETSEGLAQLVELQLFARGIAGVKEVRGPLTESLPLPTTFGLSEVADDVLRGAIPLVLRRDRGRWDNELFLPRLAYLLEQLQARSSQHLAVSLFPSRVPMPEALTAAIPKAQLFLLSGPQAQRQSAAVRAAFDHLTEQGARVLWSQAQPKDATEAAALLVLASLSPDQTEEAIVMDPAGLDAEAQLKARLPGTLRLQAIGQAGQIHYDERWINGPGKARVLATDYRAATKGWLSQDGKALLILVAHQPGQTMPSLKGLTPEPSVSLVPLGGPGKIGLSPFAARLPALQWHRALIAKPHRDRFLSDGLVRVYLRLDPKAGIPSLDGLVSPAGWRLRLPTPPKEE